MGVPSGVLFLAADACDATIVEDLVDAGELPTFSRLFAQAAYVETQAPPGLFVGAAWPTISTGLRADRHGYYTWLAREPDGYGFAQTSPVDARGTPFWIRLARAGRRIAVLDVPHMIVPDATELTTDAGEPFTGTLLSEWGCHDRHVGPRSLPAALVDALAAAHGEHYGAGPSPGFDQHAPCDYMHRSGLYRTPDEESRLFATLLEGQRAKAAASVGLLTTQDWDLFFSVLGEGHCAGHQLWHVHDTDHPRHDPAVRERLGDPLAEMYRRIDATIGDHIEAAGPDATVYVLLSHGMMPHYDGTLLLDHLLDRFATLDAGTAAVGQRTRLARRLMELPLGPRADGIACRAIARQLRRRFASHPPEVATGHTAEGLVGDAAHRAARPYFQIANNTVSGGIRLNVIGRDPSGVIERADIDASCQRLADRLRRVINVDTGEPIVADVVRADTVYRRPDGGSDELPDLLVEWNRRSLIERVWSPHVGSLHVPYEHWRTGDHHPTGLLFAMGHGIAPGEIREPIGAEDIAATVCASLGSTLPDVDGHPCPGLVATSGLRPAGVVP